MSTLQQRILDQIEATRAEHGACTMREVARQLRISPNAVTMKLAELRKAGIVVWTPVAGSLRVTTLDERLEQPVTAVATPPRVVQQPPAPVESDLAPVAAIAEQIKRGEIDFKVPSGTAPIVKRKSKAKRKPQRGNRYRVPRDEAAIQAKRLATIAAKAARAAAPDADDGTVASEAAG